MAKNKKINNDFIVNDYLTINNFVRTGIFKDFMKWGSPFKYEKFTGSIEEEKITGYICLADSNIYDIQKVPISNILNTI